MKTYSIYKVINTVNKLVYIGQTCRTMSKRFQEHTRTESPCWKLRDAMNGLGKDKFGIEFIASTSDVKTANKLEEFWSDAYDSVENGYNIRRPGNNGHSPETCEAISQTKKQAYANGLEPWNKGKVGVMPEPWNKGLAGEENILFGIPRTEEVKDKIRKTKAEYPENVITNVDIMRQGLNEYLKEKGINSTAQKLSPEQIREIQMDHRSSRKIAPEYGVHYKTIQRWKRRAVL